MAPLPFPLFPTREQPGNFRLPQNNGSTEQSNEKRKPVENRVKRDRTMVDV